MAAQFSGTSWYLTSTTLALDNPRRFTALLWHYQTTAPSLGAYNGIFSVGVSSGACAQLYNIGMGSSTFDFGIYDGTNFDETSGPAYAQAVWNHVALVYDGTLQIWVNGSYSFQITGAVPGNGIEIGNDSVSTGFNGRLDDIRIYEGVALTPTQIQREMASRTPTLHRKYSMPFRFLNRQSETDFTASDGSRPFALTKTGTAVWGEGAPIPNGTLQRHSTRRRWGDVFSAAPPAAVWCPDLVVQNPYTRDRVEMVAI